MNHYRIAVCDDENYYRGELISLLTAYENESGNAFEILTYSSGEELLEDLNNRVFHILILDVEMKGKSGIDVARDIRKNDETTVIIFATSYEHYALNAFDVSAMGYLVKPVSYLKLKKLLSNAIITVDFLKDREAARTRYIEVRVKYETVNVETNKIQYVEKRRNVSIIHTKDNEYTCYENLSHLYEKLDIHKFIYVHQGYIVNFDMIMEVTKTSVVLADYIEVPVSRRYYKEVKANFMNRIYQTVDNISKGMLNQN